MGVQCRIPVPTVEGVIGPIPLGEWALKQIKADLLADGHRVAGGVSAKEPEGRALGPYAWKSVLLPCR